jgi:hypothetical protein
MGTRRPVQVVHDAERAAEAVRGGPASPDPMDDWTEAASEARFAWPLTGSWTLTPGTPW